MVKINLTSRKGNMIMDSIVVVIILFVVSLITIYGFKIYSDLKPEIYSDVTLQESKDVLDDTETRYPNFMDGLIMFIFLGLWVMGLVAAMFSDSHPVLFGIMMIAIIFVIIAGVILGNFYEELFQDTELNTLTTNFPKTNWIMTHMLQVGIVVFLSIGLVYFARNSG